MARIILSYRLDRGRKLTPVETYSRSFDRALCEMGHDVIQIGSGWPHSSLKSLSEVVIKQNDLFIDLDCGRNKEGKLEFQLQEETISIPSAVWFIDTHGYPSLHKRLAKNYTHVFFAVYSKRDLFTKHKSARWCPNASDIKWFNFTDHISTFCNPKHTLGFFGTKGGLNRTNLLKEICKRNGYSIDAREIGRVYGHRWPDTAKAMANCKLLFNMGQKHDGPNQRVMESMLMCRPLITDRDSRDGMTQIFKEGDHFLGWSKESELADQIKWSLSNPDLSTSMACRAYLEVVRNHQTRNRVKDILNVAGIK